MYISEFSLPTPLRVCGLCACFLLLSIFSLQSILRVSLHGALLRCLLQLLLDLQSVSGDAATSSRSAHKAFALQLKLAIALPQSLVREPSVVLTGTPGSCYVHKSVEARFYSLSFSQHLTLFLAHNTTSHLQNLFGSIVYSHSLISSQSSEFSVDYLENEEIQHYSFKF